MKRCAKTPDLRISRAKLLFRTSLCLIFTLQILPSISFSQQPTQEWVARYPGPTNDIVGPYFQIDGSGNSYMTGTHQIGDSVYLLCVKYDNAGVEQWEKLYIYPGEAYIRPKGLALDSIGNVFVIAEQGPAYFLPTHGLIAKFNTITGNIDWVKRYFGEYGWAVFNDIKLDKFNNIYVAGWSDTSHLLIRYNTSGDSVWVRRNHPLAPSPYRISETATACAIDDSLNIIFTGKRRFSNPPFGSVDSVLTGKYSSSGVLRWESTYLYSITANIGEHITSDQNGNIYVGGATAISGYGVYLTLKYNRNGLQQWAKIYDAPGSGDNILTGIALDRINNSLFVTGGAVTNGIQMATTVKYNLFTGDSIWVRKDTGTYSRSNSSSIGIDSSGNIYTTGGTYNLGLSPFDILTRKYSDQSNLLWSINYNGPFNGIDYGIDLDFDNFRNVYVLATSESWTGIKDYIILKYSQLTSILTASSEIPGGFKLKQNYPNPFNPSTKIKFSIPKTAYVQVQIYDILGRTVKELVSEFKDKGVYSVTFDGTGLASGVYFYTIEAGTFKETKKMVLVK